MFVNDELALTNLSQWYTKWMHVNLEYDVIPQFKQWNDTTFHMTLNLMSARGYQHFWVSKTQLLIWNVFPSTGGFVLGRFGVFVSSVNRFTNKMTEWVLDTSLNALAFDYDINTSEDCNHWLAETGRPLGEMPQKDGPGPIVSIPAAIHEVHTKREPFIQDYTPWCREFNLVHLGDKTSEVNLPESQRVVRAPDNCFIEQWGMPQEGDQAWGTASSTSWDGRNILGRTGDKPYVREPLHYDPIK